MSKESKYKDVEKEIIHSVVPLDTVIAQDGGAITRFGDLSWNLSQFMGSTAIPASNKIVRFDFEVTPGIKASSVPGQALIRSMQELAYARLIAPPPGMKRRSPHTVIVDIVQASLLSRWLLRRGIARFSEVTIEQLDEFRDHLMMNRVWEIGDRKKGRSTLQVALILRAAQRLWEYRSVLSDALSFYPWGGGNPRIMVGFQKTRGEENKTPIIPDKIMAVLGKHAIRYIENFARDIIEFRSALESARAARLAAGYGKDRVDCDISWWIFRRLCKHTRLALDPATGAAWRPMWSRYSEFRHEERMLIAACFIVVAWLSGMRVSEILAIRERAVAAEGGRDEGRLLRVHSRLFKGVAEPCGKRESWIVVPLVAKAIETIDMMTAYQRSGADEVLFRNTSGKPLKIININEYINLFRDQVNALFAADPIPPDEDGNPWYFNTRQFRRTLARHIARQPFGVIAGMLQYKHVHIATFEGYAGVENLNTWKSLLAQEKLLANADFLEEVAHDVMDGNVAGPKGEQMLREFRGVAGDRRGDDLGYYLRHKAKNFYAGILNYCFFEPETAMCLSGVQPGARQTPVLSSCHPDRCSNSCISAKHRPAWEAAIVETEALRRTPKLSSLQRVALDQEILRMKKAIANLPEGKDAA